MFVACVLSSLVMNVLSRVRIVSAWFVGLVDMVIGMLAMILYRYCVGVCWGVWMLLSCRGKSAKVSVWSVGIRWVCGV